MNSSDAECQSEIQNELAELENQCLDLDDRLSARIEDTRARQRLWLEMEDNVEIAFEKLRTAREALQNPLPVTYDDLEFDLRDCKVGSAFWLSFIRLAICSIFWLYGILAFKSLCLS